MKKILVLNGPNLNLLGRREPEQYGRTTLADVERLCREEGGRLGVEVECRQSNHEGVLLDWLHEAGAEEAAGRLLGVVMNPGAYTHTSVALHDAVKGAELTLVEVHISNVHAREPFRHHSYVSPAARGVMVGFGVAGYLFAIGALVRLAGARRRGARRLRAGPGAAPAAPPRSRQRRRLDHRLHLLARAAAGAGGRHQAVGDGLHQHRLHVVGRHVVAPGEQRVRLGGAQHGDAGARAQPLGEPAARAGGGDQRLQVVEQRLRDVQRERRALGDDELVGRHHRAELADRVAAVAAGEQRALATPCRGSRA